MGCSSIQQLEHNINAVQLYLKFKDHHQLWQAIENAKHLEVLDLSNCYSLTANFGRILREKCQNLNTLILHGVSQTDDSTIYNISHIESLRELDLGLCRKLTDESLSNLAKNKPNTLRKLTLTGLLNITNSGIKKIISSNMETLIHLCLNILPQKSVDGQDFLELLPKCKNLVYLDISGIKYAQGMFLDLLFNQQIEFLKYINISGLAEITNVHLQTFLPICKNLEIVRASNCPLLTNSILDVIYAINKENVSESENKIKILEINRSPLISDLKIEEVTSNFLPNLGINRATNQVWSMKNIGLKIPLFNKNYVKKPKGKKASKGAKKNDDKNPINQLKKLLEESKPKRVIDLFIIRKCLK